MADAAEELEDGQVVVEDAGVGLLGGTEAGGKVGEAGGVECGGVVGGEVGVARRWVEEALVVRPALVDDETIDEEGAPGVGWPDADDEL